MDIAEYNLKSLDNAPKFNDWMFSRVLPHLYGDILEIGSGVGTYSRRLEETFGKEHVVLSDINPRIPGCLRLDLGSAESWKEFTETLLKERGMKQFDCCIALNVMEHVDPKFDHVLLSSLRERLRDKGRLVFLVPAHECLFNIIDNKVGHYRRYVKNEWIRAMAEEGFTAKHISYFNVLAIPGWYVRGNVFGRPKVGEISAGIFNVLTPMLKFVENNILCNRIGISLIGVFEK
ncbi:MAG: class I SAM-dependent methyltransferase [candidate division Zixibacteria bacterium]|nr:class I SAM-dependent methyltransferase [candidate division Zixibacteria bacterium]